MAATGPTSIEELDSPRDVLEFARVRHLDADRADADVLIAAVLWAEQHPEESIGLAATWISGGDDTGLPLAGPGAPLVTCFCIAEFASAIGRSTDSGRAVIAAGVELKYRLPGTWHRVVTGSLQAWRARRIAEYTFTLSIEAAAFVDAQVSAFAHKIGVAQLERLVHVAMERFMPEVAREKAEKAADGRHIDFHHDHLTSNGTTRLEGELDLADALDLDAAITQGAEQLAACGSEEPLDPRRAMAAGELARRQLALDLATGSANGHADGDTIGDDTTNTTKTPKPRQVVLYLHLSEAAITGAGTGLDLARVENHRRGFTADQVRGWCANPDTQVTVKPVIDLNEHLHVGAYEVPERLEEQTRLRDQTCVFPWCNRTARKCDNEHCIPYASGGTTCSCNIAPLCRRHHRLKTHSAWTYTTLEPGSFLWTSPHGYQFLRDHEGTLDVSRDRPAPSGPPGPQHFY